MRTALFTLTAFVFTACEAAPETNTASGTETTTPVPTATPAAETCQWYKVNTPDYAKGSGALTGAVRAYPTIKASKTSGAPARSLEVGIDLGSVGCGDTLVHSLEVSVAHFADPAMRDLVGQNMATLTVPTFFNEIHFSQSEAVNLKVAPGASDLIYFWTDGIHDTSPSFSRIETVVIGAKKTVRVIFSLTLPEGVSADSLTVNGTALLWTDAATGQRFRTSY